MSGIHIAMVEIAKAICSGGIGKTRKNVKQGYNFRGVDEVMNAFAPLLAHSGVIVRPKYSNRTCVERTSNSGGALIYVTVEGEFTFMHEDSSQVVVGPFYGEAMDSGDKATNKAMAVAFKYCLFQTFCVPLEGVTGGDADLHTHEVQPLPAGRPMDGVWDGISEEERQFLEDIASEGKLIFASGDVDAACDYIVSQNLDNEEKTRMWSLLDSTFRTSIKKYMEKNK